MMAGLETAGRELVVDASVALKWFLAEPDSPAALAVREAFVEGRLLLVVPELLYLEVANALRWKAGIGREAAAEALAILRGLGLEVEPLDTPLIMATLGLAYETSTTVYDAAYLAVAQRRGCRVVTADGKMVKRLAEAGAEGLAVGLGEIVE